MERKSMLPFGRMFNYGNINPGDVEVQSIGLSDRGQYVLTTDGDLYYIGLNSGGESGNGTQTPVEKWTLVGSNVHKFYSGGKAVVVIKRDYTIWSTGETSWYDSQAALSNSTVLVDRTSWYTSVIQVQDIDTIEQVGTLIFVLGKNGVLYGAGFSAYRGSLGINTSSSLYVLTQCATGVKKVKTTGNDSLYIGIDNRLYTSGWNDRGQHGTGNRIQVNLWGARASGIIDASVGATNIMYYNGTRYNTCGYTPNFIGQTVSIFTGVSDTILPNVAPLYMTNTSDASYAAMLIINNSFQKGVGSNRGLGMGGTANGVIYTPVDLNLPVSVDEIQDFKGVNGITSILTTKGEVYSTGYRYVIPGATADMTVFVKIDLPKGE